MANIMQNRTNAVLSPAQLEKVKNNISSFIALLPLGGSLTLTDEERASLTSLDVDNKAFVEDVVNEMKNNAQNIIPAFITAEQIQTDLTLFEQMDELRSVLDKARQCVDDILRIAASEAYGTSNAVYHFFKSAAEAGIPNAQSSYDKLKARYKNNGAGSSQKQD